MGNELAYHTPARIASALGKPPGPPRRLAASLHVLILVDPQGLLYAAGRLLAHAGYQVSTVFEEGHVIATILQKTDDSHLLVTSAHVSAGFCVARLIDRLRQLHYQARITYCGCEARPGGVDAHRRLPVDEFSTVPPESRRYLLDAVSWLSRVGDAQREGLSIFEI